MKSSQANTPKPHSSPVPCIVAKAQKQIEAIKTSDVVDLLTIILIINSIETKSQVLRNHHLPLGKALLIAQAPWIIRIPRDPTVFLKRGGYLRMSYLQWAYNHHMVNVIHRYQKIIQETRRVSTISAIHS